MNLDGNLDIVTEQGALFPGFGDGTFGAASLFDVGLESFGVLIADYNHDGRPDLLVGGSHGAVRLLLNERNSVNHPPSAAAGADRTVAYQDQFNDANGFFIGGIRRLRSRFARVALRMARFDRRDHVNVPRGRNSREEPGDIHIPADRVRRQRRIRNRFGDHHHRADEGGRALRRNRHAAFGSLWRTVADASAAGGRRLYNPNAGAPKVTTPAANPASFVDIPFVADPTQVYKVWIRLKADGNHFANDSVWVQFRDRRPQPAWRRIASAPPPASR